MANPQLEDGYTRIANEIIEGLCGFRMPGECRQILDCIFRKTYGFNKKEDRIANSQFVKMTGMKKQNASRALIKLIENKIVIKSDDDKLSLNKNYKEWVSFTSSSKRMTNITKMPVIKKDDVVIGTDNSVIKSDDKTSSEVMNTKDSKDTSTKDISGKPRNNNSQMAQLMEKKQEQLREQEQTSSPGISYEWQEKALRYSEELKIFLPAKAKSRWFKMFKEASTNGRGKAANLEKAYGFLKDHPRILNGEMSNEQRMMFFFKIYENGTEWMQNLKGGEK